MESTPELGEKRKINLYKKPPSSFHPFQNINALIL